MLHSYPPDKPCQEVSVASYCVGVGDLPDSRADPEIGTISEAEPRHLVDLLSSKISKRTARFDLPTLSPLCETHKSEYDTTANISRRQSYTDYSPYSSSPSTAVNSRAPSPIKEFVDEEEDVENNYQDRLNWRLASGFFAMFVGGWADGVTGTVMPYLSSEFHLTSTLSSSLFAGTTCGYFIGSLLVESIMQYLGRFLVQRNHRSIFALLPFMRGKMKSDFDYSISQARYFTVLIASVIHAMYFIMMASRSGYPVMFVAYVFSSFSRALLTAPLNAYFVAGPKQALGYALGLASFGSVASPFVFLSSFNILFLAITFQPTSGEVFKERQKALAEARHRKSLHLRSGRSSPVNDAEQSQDSDASTGQLHLQQKSQSALRRALFMPYQWAFSFFILLYCGSETATQGFMVTYLLKTRHANPKTVGYVTSGFWGGISAGRFLWGYCIPFANMAFISACAAVILHLIIWLVKSTIVDAVAVSFIGVLYGPIFPACLAMANDILPEDVQMVAMALISSFASLGGAIFPLMTGAILDARGIQALTYVTVPLAGAMACLWVLFPSRVRNQPRT